MQKKTRTSKRHEHSLRDEDRKFREQKRKEQCRGVESE